MLKNILLVGATGAIGNLTLLKLLENSELENIYVLTRRKIEINDQRVIQFITDFKNLNNLEIKSIDAGLCALGTTIKVAGSPEAFKEVDHDLVISVAAFCKARGAMKFGVVSALGANRNSKIFYNKVKGQMESDLQQMNFEVLTILRPSLLLGERTEFRLGEKILIITAPLLNLLLVGSLKKFRGIPFDYVANSLCTSLFRDKSSIVENDKII